MSIAVRRSNTANLIGRKIDGGALRLLKVLGKGAYGVVYLAAVVGPPSIQPTLYAVKRIVKSYDAGKRKFQDRELLLHEKASPHPHVVTFHRKFGHGSDIFVVLDYCVDGDLFGMIVEKQRYFDNDPLTKHVFLQLIDGVNHLHSLDIFHRDLKPENILCKNGGKHLLIADFGLSTGERTSSEFGCGSSFYMSPECQGGIFKQLGAYSTRHNDIWSLGVILVNIVTGRNPWNQAHTSDVTFKAYLRNNNLLLDILPISTETNALLKNIFTLNPMSRITLPDFRSQLSNIRSFTSDLGARRAVQVTPPTSACQDDFSISVSVSVRATLTERLSRSYSEEPRRSDQSLFEDEDRVRIPNLELSSPMVSESSSAASSIIETPPFNPVDNAEIVPELDEISMGMGALVVVPESSAAPDSIVQPSKPTNAGVNPPKSFLRNVLRSLRGTSQPQGTLN
jgi:serine/threonine protein kinase